jgi:DNA-binding transcriptional regulator YdaS (Cro superfamily)
MRVSAMLQHLVLRKAARVCGGDETLSRVLNVSIAELRQWMEGKAAAPLAVFNRAMKLVNDAYRTAR